MKKIIVVFCILLSSCLNTANLTPSYKYPVDFKKYTIPKIGETASTNIGESLLEEGSIAYQNSLFLEKSNYSPFSNINHPTGNYLLYYGNENFDFYKNEKKGSIIAKSRENNFYYMIGKKLKEIDKIYIEETRIRILNIDDFKQELIFTGANGSVLNFVYREFLEDMIRPAFNVEASYDLSNGRIVQYKGASLEILNFDNRKLTYKVLSGFKNSRK